MIVPPGFRRPARSAASIIGSPIRSFTDPPGLSISSFASSSGWRSIGPRSRVSREMRTSGVWPTRSRIEDAYSMPAGYRRPGRASGGGRPFDRIRTLRAVEAALPQEQPREALAEAARMVRRVDRARVERLDDRTEERLEPLGHEPRELELLAAARLGRDVRPGLAGELAGARRRAGRGMPCGGRCTAPRSPPSRAARSAPRFGSRSAPRRCGTRRCGPAGPLTVPSGICTNTAPVADDGPGRRDVGLDAEPAAPHRQQPADPVDQPLTPARGEGGRRAAEEPRPGLQGDRVHRDERVHPAAVGRRR